MADSKVTVEALAEFMQRELPKAYDLFEKNRHQDDVFNSASWARGRIDAEQKVGEGRIKTQPGKFSVTGEGLCVGRDGGSAVTDDYPGSMPWSFTGGTIHRVAVNVSGEPYVDLEREAVAIMSRE